MTKRSATIQIGIDTGNATCRDPETGQYCRFLATGPGKLAECRLFVYGRKTGNHSKGEPRRLTPDCFDGQGIAFRCHDCFKFFGPDKANSKGRHAELATPDGSES